MNLTRSENRSGFLCLNFSVTFFFDSVSLKHNKNLNQRSTIMIMSTTNNLDGREVKKYLGVVTGEAILGANIFKDFLQASETLLVVGLLLMSVNFKKPED